ncbi:SPOR domain-containing protein [Dysgonomonas sp. Marseille-P4677]|uniref:HU domain-containing protein n=1 Tax=Dysgonomonas sp. Marseille-P4677 TaxID=2364790 RepID=UPI0019145AC1|nr:SPOR domain-containing protein [Dysgonomonas sp. Marseille-P4677]MBK5719462.1 SPOR domain-containing protein [Dysgonomonas sp. Marseille-P4677]
MKTIIFDYLEFSLSEHNCVIIPDFGGFIINIDPAILCSNGVINPPKQSIVFNPELKHDDGILTSYISKDENISYNAASKKIKDFVSVLRSDIKSGKSVQCSKLGELKINDEGNISFITNKLIYFPSQFGLYPTEMKRLSVIENIATREKRNVSLKYTTSSIAAAVAAILLFIAPSGNIKDVNLGNTTQKADFISSITTSLTAINDNKDNVFSSAFTSANETVPEKNTTIPTRTYYIIIGGEETKNRADILLEKIQKNSFPKAQMLTTSDRYRIYISSFDDKTQAEAFLETFRKENPAFETAWLYSKRNY